MSNYGSAHIYYLWRERATKCKQRVPISNSSRIRIFVETIVSNIFKLERLWLSVLIFETRHKTDKFISVQRSTQLLRILSTLAVVNSVASTELSLASKNHNNSRKVWEKNLVKSWCAKIVEYIKSNTTERRISTVLWTKAVLYLVNHRIRIKVWRPRK